MLRILAAVMLLLPVNLQRRASQNGTPGQIVMTVKMKDATLSSVFAEVERTSRYAFIYTDDVRPLLDRRVSIFGQMRPSTNCCPRSSRERS